MGDYWTNPVRHPEDVGIQYVRRTVLLGQADLVSTNGIAIGALEAGATPAHVDVYVDTAFNAGTTNVLTVGTAATPDGFATSAGIAANTTGWKDGLKGTLSGIPLATNQIVYAKFTQTGTAATTGKAVITMTFRPKREVEGIPFPNN